MGIEEASKCLLQMAATRECYSVGPKRELLISGHVTTVNTTIQILIRLRLTNAHAAATQPTPSEYRGGRGGSATGNRGGKHCRSSKAKMVHPPRQHPLSTRRHRPFQKQPHADEHHPQGGARQPHLNSKYQHDR